MPQRSPIRILSAFQRLRAYAGLLAAACTLCTTAPADANTILLDTFTRTGSLAGSSADTGQPWITSGAWSTNGAELVAIGNNSQRIAIPFLPNKTYELSLDLDVTSGGPGWISFGYANTGPTNSFNANRGAMLHRQSPSVQTRSSGNGGGVQIFTVANTFPKTLSILLDTGPTLASSSLTYKVNGSLIGSPKTTDASSVNGVFIQPNGGMGSIDNFRLTVVPEPTSATLAAMLAVAALRRRKRG